MKILVCVSIAPESTTKINFNATKTALDKNGVVYAMNPYDEWYALVRAVELAEQLAGSKVTMVHVGGAESDAILRKGLAIGADQALRIDAEAKSAFYVAKQIERYAKGFDVIFVGKETIEYNGAEVGAMLAEMLDLPFISFATELQMNGNVATISREIEGGKEVLEVSTPFVVSAAKGLAEQRIPNMKGIMQAKNKPLAVRPPVEVDEPVAVVGYEYPPQKAACRFVEPENMDELVRLLHEEAKVI